MNLKKTFYYFADTSNGTVRLRVGRFYEVLDSTEMVFISGVILGLYQLTKIHNAMDLQLLAYFQYPIREQQSVSELLLNAGMIFDKYPAKLSDGKRYFGKMFSLFFQLEPEAVQVRCNSNEQIHKLLEMAWPNYRMVFRICKAKEAALSDRLDDWDFVNSQEDIPEHLLVYNVAIACEFFHGFWIDIKARGIPKSQLIEMVLAEGRKIPLAEVIEKDEF